MLIAFILLSACSSKIHFESNVDASTINEYFSFEQVRIVNSLAELDSNYKIIGLVEGEACQQKSHHQAPNESEARTDARRKAAKIGANAIVFSGCPLIESSKADNQCVASRVCYGQALFIKKNNQ